MRRFLAYAFLTSAILAYFDPRLVIYFAFAYIPPIVAERLGRRLRPFIILYVLLEEAVAYYLGGGLHGQARSLRHDYARSVPIFLVHFYLRDRYACDKKYLYASLHGIFREVLLDFSRPALLLSGPAMFVYGYPLVLSNARGPCERPAMVRAAILAAEILVGILAAVAFPRKRLFSARTLGACSREIS